MNDMSRTSRVVTVTDQMGAGIWSVCKVAKKTGESLGAFFFKQSLFRLVVVDVAVSHSLLSHRFCSLLLVQQSTILLLEKTRFC